MAPLRRGTRHLPDHGGRSGLTAAVTRNRAVLARQLLLERAALPLTGVLEQMGGLQAQYAPSMYVGLWSRLAGFARDDLTRALERREVVQGTLLRATIHLVSAADYWPFAVAVGEARRRWWLTVRKDVTAADMERAASVLGAALADGPRSRRDLEPLVPPRMIEGVHLWLDIVRVPPGGTWERRRADVYADARQWLGPPRVDPDDAIDHVVRRYLGGFGPATAKEISLWAGLSLATVRASLDRLPTHETTADDGRTVVDLDGLGVAWTPPADVPAPVRFLPTWDAALLAHARAAAIIAEEHRPLVFTSKNPQSVGTFLVDGVVAGTWRLANGVVHTDPFVSLGRRALGVVAAEATRLSAFMV